MKARKEGKCPECRKPIRVGDEISCVRGRWLCAACADRLRSALGPVTMPTDEEIAGAKAGVEVVIDRMLGRGAPVKWDDQGFNKYDHPWAEDFLCGSRWGGGEGPDKSKAATWVTACRILYKYREQIRSMNLWEGFEAAKAMVERWADAVDATWAARRAEGRPGQGDPGPGQASSGCQGAGRGVRAGLPRDPQEPGNGRGVPGVATGQETAHGGSPGTPGGVTKGDIQGGFSVARPGRRRGGCQGVPGPVPPAFAPVVQGAEVRVAFPFDETMIDRFRALPKRRWGGKQERAWFVPVSLALEAAKALDQGDATMQGIAAAIRALPEVEVAGKDGSAACGLSRALSGDQAGEEGAAVVAEVEAALAPVIPDGLSLYPFQAVGVGFLKAARGKAIVADEMGTGKSIEALAFILFEREQGRDPLPAVVVCPNTLKRNWRREAERWCGRAGLTVAIANGVPAAAADIIIVNYEAMRKKVQVEEVQEGRTKTTRVASVVGLPEKPGTLIVDECHRVKNAKAQQSKAVLAYAGIARSAIFMSGTPLLNRTNELWNAVHAVAPDSFPSWWKFSQRYCGAYRDRFGYNSSGSSNLDELRTRLLPIMLRRTKEQVLKELGPKRRAVLTVELDNRTEYDRAEADVVDWIQNTTLESLIAEGFDTKEAEQEARRKAEAAMRAEHLVRMNKLRILAGVGKVPAIADWIEDFLDGGRKLVVFSHHHEVIAALREGLGKAGITGIVELTGHTKEKDRQGVIDRFQGNDETRVFIGTTPAGGVGITLTAASDVLFLEREWVPGDEEQAEDRCHRIGQEAGVTVTAWYATAEGSIDEDFEAVVEKKRAVFKRVVDGQFVAKGPASVLGDVTKRMMKRHGSEKMEDDHEALESAGAFDVPVGSPQGQAILQAERDGEVGQAEAGALAREEFYVFGTHNGRD